MQDFPGFEDAGTLAAWTAGMLATYAGTAGRKVLAELTDRTANAATGKLCEKARGLWGWLKGRWSGDPIGMDQLEKFEDAPQARKDDLGALLKQHIESDKNFRSAIQPLLKELADLHAQAPRQTTHGSQIAVGDNIRQIQGDNNTQH